MHSASTTDWMKVSTYLQAYVPETQTILHVSTISITFRLNSEHADSDSTYSVIKSGLRECKYKHEPVEVKAHVCTPEFELNALHNIYSTDT